MWSKTNIIFIFILFSGTCTNLIKGQVKEDSTLVFLKAEVVTRKNEFLEGKVSLTSDYLMQYNIMFIDTVNWKTYYFSPRDIEYVKYHVHSNQYKMVSLDNPRGDGLLLMKEVYKGNYSLYQLVDQDHSQTVLSYVAFYYLRSDKWIMPGITNLNFVYDGSLIFADCPELSRKIKNGEYRYSDLYEIMEKFNDCGIPNNFDYLMDPEY